ncbi:Mth938-like domain-containing protein [Rhodoferax sp. GW822-FHT02A01]|uniref:Mth938-like domain-containing protein n=1 Tax=Rhodoferax sp. GW822-FHT02A01 TaxID=3141537 RepID=UPI00315D83FD
MKLLPDASNRHSITGYGPGWVSVNGERFTSSLYISPQKGTSIWQCPGFDGLSAEHFDVFADMQPELIVFGSGDRIRFPHPRCLQNLYRLRIGVETMDTQAACRTFNFLAGEGRRVIAALLV